MVVIGTSVLVFFRMDVSTATAFYSRLCSGAPGAWPDGRWLLLIAPSFWLDLMQARHGDDVTFDHWPRLARATLLAAVVILWFLLSRNAPPAPFIYRGF
jgi:hypothetical protein